MTSLLMTSGPEITSGVGKIEMLIAASAAVRLSDSVARGVRLTDRDPGVSCAPLHVPHLVFSRLEQDFDPHVEGSGVWKCRHDFDIDHQLFAASLR